MLIRATCHFCHTLTWEDEEGGTCRDCGEYACDACTGDYDSDGSTCRKCIAEARDALSSAAFMAGRKVGFQRLSHELNPHAAGFEHDAWRNGWQSAADQIASDLNMKARAELVNRAMAGVPVVGTIEEFAAHLARGLEREEQR